MTQFLWGFYKIIAVDAKEVNEKMISAPNVEFLPSRTFKGLFLLKFIISTHGASFYSPSLLRNAVAVDITFNNFTETL